MTSGSNLLGAGERPSRALPRPDRLSLLMPMVEQWRAWRQLRAFPDLSAAARDGDPARLTGIVRPLGETLVAPLSGRTSPALASQRTMTS